MTTPTTTTYSVELELDRMPPSGQELDELLDALVDFHPSVSRGQGRSTNILLTVPARSIRQATITAIALVDTYGTVTRVTAQTTERLELEQDWPTIPDLVSVAEAATILKVTRQRVLQMINEGKLPRHTIGTTNAIPRTALTARR